MSDLYVLAEGVFQSPHWQGGGAEYPQYAGMTFAARWFQSPHWRGGGTKAKTASCTPDLQKTSFSPLDGGAARPRFRRRSPNHCGI